LISATKLADSKVLGSRDSAGMRRWRGRRLREFHRWEKAFFRNRNRLRRGMARNSCRGKTAVPGNFQAEDVSENLMTFVTPSWRTPTRAVLNPNASG
jgi:hypothetical protein